MEKGRFRRQDRLIKEKRHDSYRDRAKIREGAVCGSCDAAYLAGRWTWGPASEPTFPVTCPACQRIADSYPAGYFKIRGDFFSDHRDEIMNLLRNTEEQEKALHPMERIMEVKEEMGGVQLTTTGIHLARLMGENLSRSYQGHYSFKYEEGESRIRVNWER